MSTFTNNNVASGDLVRASDHNTQGANIAAVVNGNIEADNLASNAVTTAKIADASVTNAKFNTAAGELGGEWQDWTPTYTNLAGGTLNYAKYTKVGKTIEFRFKYTLGGAGISGGVTVSVPSNLNAGMVASNETINASVLYTNNGVGSFPGVVRWASSSTISLFASNASATYTSTTNTSSSVPFTWGTGDILSVAGSYEAA